MSLYLKDDGHSYNGRRSGKFIRPTEWWMNEIESPLQWNTNRINLQTPYILNGVNSNDLEWRLIFNDTYHLVVKVAWNRPRRRERCRETLLRRQRRSTVVLERSVERWRRRRTNQWMPSLQIPAVRWRPSVSTNRSTAWLPRHLQHTVSQRHHRQTYKPTYKVSFWRGKRRKIQLETLRDVDYSCTFKSKIVIHRNIVYWKAHRQCIPLPTLTIQRIYW